jgi:hypothetical protein
MEILLLKRSISYEKRVAGHKAVALPLAGLVDAIEGGA